MDTETGAVPQTAGVRPARAPGRALSAEELAALVTGGDAQEKPRPADPAPPIAVLGSPEWPAAAPQIVEEAPAPPAYANGGLAAPADLEPAPLAGKPPLVETPPVELTQSEVTKDNHAEPSDGLATTPPAGAPPASAPPPASPPSIAVADERRNTAATKVAARSTARGHFDAVRLGRAEGWAFDSAHPDRKLKVEIWADDAFVAVGDADLYREDLKKAGMADGKVHFSIRLPARLYDGEEHVISPRLAATGEAFGAPIAMILLGAEVTVKIELIAGSTLRGFVDSRSGVWRTVDMFVDNELIHSIDAVANSREPINLELPARLLDGCVHWFQFKSRDDGLIVGEAVETTSFVSTPELALQQYARSYPAILSANAARRYRALSQQIEHAAAYVAAQAPGPNRLTLPAYYEQVALAHQQVQHGVTERTGKPKPLNFLRYVKPRVSIVIPAHNKFWVTYNCLAALILAPNQTTAEIIVVDDGSSDQTVDLGKCVSGVTIVRNETAQGFIKSSNRGAEAARGDFVVMLNNDTEPCAGWLDELMYVFENFRDVGLVGAKFIYPDGKLQEAGGILFPNLKAWNYGRNQNPHDPRYNYIREIDYCSGACIMLRAEVWRKLKGFDEFYTPAYYEDTDLAFRVRDMGLKTYYTPFSEIIHFEGLSSGTSTSSGVKRFQAINEPKFRSRWAPTIRRFPATTAPDLAKDRGIALRALVIDAQPPQPDKDAGSYAAIQEMRLLQALGVKVSFVPQNMAYLGNYTEALQRMGVECLFAPFQSSVEAVIQERGAEFDFIYITRYSVAEHFIDLIRSRAPNAKIVFCNADLHFLREVRAAVAARDPEMMEKAKRTREIELNVMRRTDVTLSYTETEAAVIASHNLDGAKVMKCPWVVEAAAQAPPFEARSGVAFLGSYNHPPNEEAVVYFVNEIMPELRRRLPGVKFHVYGSNAPKTLKALADDDVVIEGFVDDVAEVYNGCRVFVAPLRSGAGIKGKVIGALAAGAPSVVSPLAAEGIGLSAGSEAFVAEAPEDWVRAIVSLYQDEARWNEMSKRALEFVKQNFSFEDGVKRMRAALAVAGVYTD